MQSWQYKPAQDLGLPRHQWTRSLQRESGLASTLGHLLWRLVIRALLHFFFRLEVRHRHHLPPSLPLILISNHTSHLDALILSSLLPLRWCDHVFPVAAGDVFFETPRVSWFAAVLLNALPMWRKRCGRHALVDLRQRLIHDPCGYILFPEGTRSPDGRMQTFRPGIGMLTAAAPVPVVPCLIEGAYESLPRHRRLPRPHPIRVTLGAPLCFESLPDTHESWQTIATALHAAVEQLRTPTPPR